MEVILLEKIEKLGKMGDLVNVKSGYARNYLIPNNKCLRATEENKKYFADKKEELEKKSIDSKNSAQKLLPSVENLRLDIIKSAGEAGHLYGSVKAQDIVNYLSEKGIKLNKSQVMISDTIRTIGVFKVNISLHPEISTIVFANVSRTKDECNSQFNLFLEESKKQTQEAQSN